MTPTPEQIQACRNAASSHFGGDAYEKAYLAKWEEIRPKEDDNKLQEMRERWMSERAGAYDLAAQLTSLKAELAALKATIPAPLVFPDPPQGWEWHNPKGLTPEQVGIADDWRLCLKEEVCDLPDEWWTDSGWRGSVKNPRIYYGTLRCTFRTKAPLPAPKPTDEELERAEFEAWWLSGASDYTGAKGNA